jgi:hypothetical protein
VDSFCRFKMGLLSVGPASLGRLLALGAAVALAFEDHLRMVRQPVQRRDSQGGIAGKGARLERVMNLVATCLD